MNNSCAWGQLTLIFTWSFNGLQFTKPRGPLLSFLLSEVCVTEFIQSVQQTNWLEVSVTYSDLTGEVTGRINVMRYQNYLVWITECRNYKNDPESVSEAVTCIFWVHWPMNSQSLEPNGQYQSNYRYGAWRRCHKAPTFHKQRNYLSFTNLHVLMIVFFIQLWYFANSKLLKAFAIP